MNKFNTIRDIDVKGKRVLVRVDFNVPLDGEKVTDDTRIRAALPTIEALLKEGASVILMSHLGRPKGKKDPKYSLKPAAARLAELLGREVKMAPDCIGEEVANMAKELKAGDVLLLENVRFYAQETDNDEAFAKELASLGEVYVNDAFGSAHRAHASTTGIAKFLPAAAGLLMERELSELGKLLDNPAEPFVVLLGGAKVSDKIGVMQNLIGKADYILVGGGMAFPFLKVRGLEIGKSLCDGDLEVPKSILAKAEGTKTQILLPIDVVAAAELAENAPNENIDVENIPADKMGLDIGPKTVAKFQDIIAQAKTIFWNGPMGVFEKKPFDLGTRRVAQAVADSQARSVVGGGDSVAALTQAGLAPKITHVSTGGGASLEFVEGRQLPGVVALSK
ncbi:MAG: phosphoglycerate kinase [bacterium]|nr:phosphoglycerate kinase [bacterium]